MKNLTDKTVAITGATGGLGKEICVYLVASGASLILLDRNVEKSKALGESLLKAYPQAKIHYITTDLEDFQSVKDCCEIIKNMDFDVFIHNAGAYSIPRKTCKTGYDNVFQINFISPYYMIRELLPKLRKKKGSRVIIVGSIAHNYSKSDENDIDFSTRKASSKVYGNAKRYLMFSLFELFKGEKNVSLAVTHPGITFTNITAHYPKLIFAIIKHPMKIIFHSPKKAALCIFEGMFQKCAYHEWIGPRFFDIWGKPKLKKLTTCKEAESKYIGKTAEDIYTKLRS